MSPEEDYAEFIKALPALEVPFAGVSAWLIKGGPAQVVFFELPGGSEVPPHSHCAQWGIIVEGELEFTIGDQIRTYRKGDAYFIGEGEEHSARVPRFCRAIDVFADPNRY